ncbi:MAG: hypothetical protein EZS28_020405 [Streblomastix strix]|uniref:Uncharacterized protein n=1 Tax=Streblomastix strix TaxID=222440 RepID=A0A5J4VNY4_9EUKA|nr:MAG: hypothetical protein EZS28_020405 [Streblomastix strix]
MEKNITVQLIKYYLSGHSYRDLLLNLPGPPIGYGGKSINIFKELDRINDLQHENTFDFYQNITQLFNSLHCDYALFTTPCFNSFAIIIPYLFRFEIDPISGRHIAYGQKYETLEDLDEKYNISVYGSEINYINILGLDIYDNETYELNEGSYTPEEAIVNWANQYEGYYSNPYAKEEYARTSSFYVRPIMQYVIPQSFNITYGYIDHTDSRWKINERSKSMDDYVKVYEFKDSSLSGYFVPSLKLGIIRIKSFLSEEWDDFQYSLYMIVRQLADKNSPFHSQKILIDLRYSSGGYVRYPYLIFRFLFPQADSPIWPQSDWVKSDVNSIYGVISDFQTKFEIEDSDIFLDDQTGEVIYNYYNLEGSQRTTSVNLDDGVQLSITVNLTKRATYYAGHLDKFKEYSLDWNSFRSVHWQPKDVITLVNGQTDGPIAMFAKQIHQKKVGRIVALGNFGGVHKNTRFDVGSSAGASAMNNQYIKQFHDLYLEDPDLFKDYEISLDVFPKPFFRKDSFIQFAHIEFYGTTPKTADYLNEFHIYDADFHINYAEQYGDLFLEDEDKDYQLYI